MQSDKPLPYPVRLPADMRAKLTKEAKKERRSLHAEILLRLDRSLNQQREIRA